MSKMDNILNTETKGHVNKGTSMDTDGLGSLSCKYCSFRLSKLKILDMIRSRTNIDQNSEIQSTRSSKQRKLLVDRSCQTSASLFEKAEMTQKELRSLALILRYRNGKTLKSETFCKCVLQGKERDCRCGEDEKYFDWSWDTKHRSQATYLQEDNRQVIFHKDYSCGTAAIRGESPMDIDQHFWEIKMTSPVYGTDMMIGVGTGNVEMSRNPNSFCSMLGSDMESWGISYDGRVQHAGKKREYSSRFGQGAIIGVHLDMWHGTLAYFKNRHSLGIAFKGLRGRNLYPMACSTAARSGMKVISSRSFPSSLQFLCCRRLRQFVPAHLSVLDALSMPPGLRGVLANNMTWLLSVPQTSDPNLSSPGYICSICLPLKRVLESCTEEEESDEESQINHISLHLADSDDESSGHGSTSSDIQDTPELTESSSSATQAGEHVATISEQPCGSGENSELSSVPLLPSPTKRSRLAIPTDEKQTVVAFSDKGENTDSDLDNSKSEVVLPEVDTCSESNLSSLLGKRKY